MVNVGLMLFICFVSSSYGNKIKLTSDGPVVVGATVTFHATITDDNNRLQSGSYQFKWRDDAIPSHSETFEGDFSTSVWRVTYPKNLYSPGTYEVQVEVSRWTLFYWPVGRRSLYFELTSLLNGDMGMKQNNKTLVNNYVSSASEVTHYIQLKEQDQAFLTQNATSVVAYWFVNCIYYGATSDLTFRFNYTNATNQEQHVETLVVASFDPLPPPTTPAPIPTTTLPPTTTTVSPNGTTVKTTTTAKPTTTTIATTTEKHQPSKNITALVQPNLKLGTNVSQIPILPYVCFNTSIVPPDPKKTYGYFMQKVEVKAPVANVQFSPNNWLKHGEILNLSVTCNGSAPFLYCFLITEGEYNTTGNETCTKEQLISDCQLNLRRYFHYSGSYTVLIIISNQVSRKITPVGVNIYEVKKHPQLSVIVVPVACSAIAVTLIVFGAAYYMQSRHRYTIEVADFDFAQASDLEYMTFSQRLKMALNNAFNRTHEVSYSRIDGGSTQRY